MDRAQFMKELERLLSVMFRKRERQEGAGLLRQLLAAKVTGPESDGFRDERAGKPGKSGCDYQGRP